MGESDTAATAAKRCELFYSTEEWATTAPFAPTFSKLNSTGELDFNDAGKDAGKVDIDSMQEGDAIAFKQPRVERRAREAPPPWHPCCGFVCARIRSSGGCARAGTWAARG